MKRLTKNVNGITVELDEDEEMALMAEWTYNADQIRAVEYISKRKASYPSIEDQLDMIYHNGLDVWKDKIKAIKDKYPKPS